MQYTLFDNQGGSKLPTDWTTSRKMTQPVKRMIELWNNTHARKIKMTANLTLAHENSQVAICEVETGLGKAFAIFAKNSPYNQASVYHKRSNIKVETLDRAKELGHNLWTKFTNETP